MSFSAKWLILTSLGLFIGSGAWAAKVTERAKQKTATEAEHADLQRKLRVLKLDIERTEAAKENAADSLAESEDAISNANRTLRNLANEQKQAESKLKDLEREQLVLTNRVSAQKKQLTRLMRDQYIAGNEDRIKLLLSGDNPNRINRELQYMGYVSQAQAKLIDALRINLRAVENNKLEMQHANDTLEEISKEEREQKTVLEQEKQKHALLLSKLSAKLVTQRKEASNLERDEKRLAKLIEKLAKLAEEQKKADALAQERRRQEKLASANVEKERRNSTAPKARDEEVVEAPAKTAVQEASPPAFNGAFANLRGQLRLPVRGGSIASKFGTKRGDAPTLKGLFIKAAEGVEVEVVAAGKVIFADWLRGFGNLIIVDHGNQYISIYGNNQALFKRAGDTVKGGDAIASTGNSGGNEQSGLYFEMRYQGRAFDPLTWMAAR